MADEKQTQRPKPVGQPGPSGIMEIDGEKKIFTCWWNGNPPGLRIDIQDEPTIFFDLKKLANMALESLQDPVNMEGRLRFKERLAVARSMVEDKSVAG